MMTGYFTLRLIFGAAAIAGSALAIGAYKLTAGAVNKLAGALKAA